MKNYTSLSLLVMLSIFLFCGFALSSDSQTASNLNIKHENSSSVKGTSLDHATDNYLMALKQDNEGVVESAIIKVMKLKYYYPEKDYSEIKTQLEKLELDGQTESIRFMAYIVSNYLKHPERFAWVKKGVDENSDHFFSLINDQVVAQVNK
jgi:hypothetical protein